MNGPDVRKAEAAQLPARHAAGRSPDGPAARGAGRRPWIRLHLLARELADTSELVSRPRPDE